MGLLSLFQERSALCKKYSKYFPLSVLYFIFASFCSALLFYLKFHTFYDLLFLFITSVLLIIFIPIVLFFNFKIFGKTFNILKMIILFVLIFSSIYFRTQYLNENNLSGSKIYKVIKSKRLQNSRQIILQDTGSKKKFITYIPFDKEISFGDYLRPASEYEINKLNNNSYYIHYLNSAGINNSIYLKNFYTIKSKSRFYIKVSEFRNILLNKINLKLPDDSSNILKALIFGNKSFLSKKQLYYAKRCGIMHLFAASGLHVGIIAFIPFLIFSRLKFKKITIYLLISFILIFYLLLADFPISLTRSCLMFFLAGLHIFLFKPTNTYNILFLSGLICILTNPHLIFDIGFQLSFFATAGIIYFYKPISKALAIIPSYLNKTISISLSAQLFVIPIIALHFKEANLTSIFSNIIFIPLISVVFILGILILIFGQISFIHILLLKIYNGLVVFSFYLINLFSKINLHFTGENIYIFLLISPVTILIILFLKKFKYITTSLILSIYIISIISFTILNRYNLKNGNTKIINNSLFINDFLNASLDINQINFTYYSRNIDNSYLIISKNDQNSLINYKKAIKYFNVKEVYIIDSLKITNSFYSLFNIIEQENIYLEIIKIDKINILYDNASRTEKGGIIFWNHLIRLQRNLQNVIRK